MEWRKMVEEEEEEEEWVEEGKRRTGLLPGCSPLIGWLAFDAQKVSDDGSVCEK